MASPAASSLAQQQSRTIVSTCCFSQKKSDFKRTGLLPYQHYCESPEFTTFVSQWGLGDVSFELNPYIMKNFAWNPYIMKNTSLHDNFTLSIESLPDISRLGIVFHGTPPPNVEGILQKGLDPEKRRGQAYGKGEYFSKDPGLSLTYCRGGGKMLVFLVVLPEAPIEIDEPNANDQPSLKRRYIRRCPPQIVVVENNAYQLPLGVLSFQNVDYRAMSRSNDMKRQLQMLTEQMENKRKRADESLQKAEIIQLLIKGLFDIASEKYQKCISILTSLSKREISMYVHRLVEEDVVSFYFPDLPDPMTVQEHYKAPILTVETLDQQALDAKENLAKEEERLKKEQREQSAQTSKTEPTFMQHGELNQRPVWQGTSASASGGVTTSTTSQGNCTENREDEILAWVTSETGKAQGTAQGMPHTSSSSRHSSGDEEGG